MRPLIKTLTIIATINDVHHQTVSHLLIVELLNTRMDLQKMNAFKIKDHLPFVSVLLHYHLKGQM